MEHATTCEDTGWEPTRALRQLRRRDGQTLRSHGWFRTPGTDPASGVWKEGTMVTQVRPQRLLAYSTTGRQRDLARDACEPPWWDAHATFIDGLLAEGLIWLGGR